MPQTHPLGYESEVDFGSVGFYLDGVPTGVDVRHAALGVGEGLSPCSCYLNEAQEAFLDGHVRAFEHFGGVPERIRFRGTFSGFCARSRYVAVPWIGLTRSW